MKESSCTLQTTLLISIQSYATLSNQLKATGCDLSGRNSDLAIGGVKPSSQYDAGSHVASPGFYF